MAEEIGDAYVSLGVRDTEYNAKMAAAQAHLQNLARAGTVAKFALAAAIGAGLQRFMEGARVAAEKSEQATMDLGIAAKFTGQNVSKILPVYEAFAAQIQKTTAFDDEAVRSAMALGLSLGIASDKIEEATRAAVGMSAVTGGDLQSSMTALVKGNIGVTRQLKMYGIQVDENASSEENFNTILRQTGQLFQIAEARAGTTSGSFKKIANAWDEIKESVGRGLNNFFQLDIILPAISDLLVKLGGNSDDVKKVVDALSDVDIQARQSAKVIEETEKKKQEAMKRTMSVMSAKELWNKLAEAGLRFIPPKAAPVSTAASASIFGPNETIPQPGIMAAAGANTLTPSSNFYAPSYLPGRGANTVSVVDAPGFDALGMSTRGAAGSTLMPSMQKALDSDGGLKISGPSIKRMGSEIADRWRNTVFE